MDTRLLRSFVTVAEELHFRRAAERLHIAQPAVSRQIKRLEKELEVQLFIRDRRTVVLTEAGRVFLKEARTILQRGDLAQQMARRAARGEIGTLSVGYAQFSSSTGSCPRWCVCTESVSQGWCWRCASCSLLNRLRRYWKALSMLA
jgi:DNA-binding transcriptional LysR family regulator